VLHAQLLVLMAWPGQLLTLGRARTIALLLPAAFRPAGLNDPVSDRLGSGFELARRVSRVTASADQVNEWRRNSGEQGGCVLGMKEASCESRKGSTGAGQDQDQPGRRSCP